MNVDTLVFRVAGIMVTAGVVLAYTHHIACSPSRFSRV